MKLSKRLQAIFDMVPNGVTADIGSDHGKLIISLFQNGIISTDDLIDNKIYMLEKIKEYESSIHNNSNTQII